MTNKTSKVAHEELSPILREFDDYISNRSQQTRSTYLYILCDLDDFLFKINRLLENLQRKDVQEYLDTRRKKCSMNRVHYDAGVIKTFAEWLWEEGKISEEEFRKIKKYTKSHKKATDEVGKREALSEDEIRKLFEIRNPLVRMLIWIGLNFGLRRNEVCNLKLSDIDFDKMLFIIRYSKEYKTRAIPMFTKQVKTIKEWLRLRGQLGHDYVFSSVTGRRLSRDSSNRYYKQISKQTGIHVYSHRLRYTYAVTLWRNKVDIFIISKMLGHANIQTTMIYLRVPEEEVRQRYREEAQRCFGRESLQNSIPEGQLDSAFIETFCHSTGR